MTIIIKKWKVHEQMTAVDNMRYALYEIRDSLKYDKKYIGEFLIADKALAIADQAYGRWNGGGIVPVSLKEIDKLK